MSYIYDNSVYLSQFLYYFKESKHHLLIFNRVATQMYALSFQPGEKHSVDEKCHFFYAVGHKSQFSGRDDFSQGKSNG